MAGLWGGLLLVVDPAVGAHIEEDVTAAIDVGANRGINHQQ